MKTRVIFSPVNLNVQSLSHFKILFFLSFAAEIQLEADASIIKEQSA